MVDDALRGQVVPQGGPHHRIRHVLNTNRVSVRSWTPAGPQHDCRLVAQECWGRGGSSLTLVPKTRKPNNLFLTSNAKESVMSRPLV